VPELERNPFHLKGIKINLAASYKHHGALLKVSAKAGHFTEAMKNCGEVLSVIFEW
jgi:hypothetical protein